MRSARTFLPASVLVASLLVAALLLGVACSGNDGNPGGRSSTPSVSPSAGATPAPSASEPSPAESPPPVPRPVPATEAFKGLKKYLLLPVSGPVRRRAKRSFQSSTGENLYGFAMKRAVSKKHPSRVASVLVLSIEPVDGETAETFQTKAVEALSQQVSSIAVEIKGRAAYVSRAAGERSLSRLFYFFHDTVLVQIFGKDEIIQDLAAALIESESKES
jgi:hypothetical protein